jgi:CDP-glucose 4,6-dehydratase
MIDPTFWRGRRVFLTGHTGFKGGWMSLWLQQLGAEVTGYSLPPVTDPSLFEVAQVGAGMTSLFGDIRDAAALLAAVKAAEPEIVIHMAAQPLVRYSYAHPVETYSTNVMGLVNLLESIRATPTVRAAINVTSDKCYENNEQMVSFTEDQPMGGYDPYSSSKGCAELVTSAYRRSYFGPDGFDKNPLALASGRAGNVIGGGDWSLDRLVPDILAAFADKAPVRIRSPNAIRPWQHVLEPVCG